MIHATPLIIYKLKTKYLLKEKGVEFVIGVLVLLLVVMLGA